jgi:broad specificity phosphatase PhoE
MPSRLTFICAAATSALRRGAFPEDEALEAQGMAKALAARGALHQADQSWTSPALRARQTADALGLAAAIDPALGECDFGRWRGRSLAEIEAAEPEAVAAWLGDSAASPHGGESVVDLLRRAASWLAAHENASGHTVAVTHPALIRAAIAHILAADPRSFWRIDIEPLSRTSLFRNNGVWTLRTLGCPLAAPQDPRRDAAG